MHNLLFEKEKKTQKTPQKNNKTTTTAKHKTNALLDLLFFPIIFL